MIKTIPFAKRFWSRVRREVAREARENMMSYAAARQSFDIYEMRLEALETGLIRKIVTLEAEVATLRADLDAAAQPRPRAVGE